MTVTARVYFFDKNGKELVDHSLNGKVFTGTERAPLKRDGSVAGLYRVGIRLCNYCDINRTLGYHVATLADFPGHDRIGVKAWFNPQMQDKFWLVAEDYFTSREPAREPAQEAPTSPKLRVVA